MDNHSQNGQDLFLENIEGSSIGQHQSSTNLKSIFIRENKKINKSLSQQKLCLNFDRTK